MSIGRKKNGWWKGNGDGQQYNNTQSIMKFCQQNLDNTSDSQNCNMINFHGSTTRRTHIPTTTTEHFQNRKNHKTKTRIATTKRFTASVSNFQSPFSNFESSASEYTFLCAAARRRRLAGAARTADDDPTDTTSSTS